MVDLTALSLRRSLPPNVERMIEECAWGDLLRALEGGLSVNLAYADNRALFGDVVYMLGQSGPDGFTHAAWGPMAVIESFIARGLSHIRTPHVTAVVDVVASGQWEWLPALIDAGYPLETPGGRLVFHEMTEGRMARRLRGKEELWEDMEFGVGLFAFNQDTGSEMQALEKTCRLLVAAGANIEQKDAGEDECEPLSPLVLAVMYADEAMVSSLLAAGACVHFDPGEDPLGMNALHPLSIAAKEGLPGILDILLAHSGLRVIGHHGVDAMHVAASCEHIECMEVLLKHGIDGNCPTRQGQYFPLHQAALQGKAKAIDWLLARGASWEMGGDFSAKSVLCSHQPDMARTYKLAKSDNNIIPLRPSGSRVSR